MHAGMTSLRFTLTDCEVDVVFFFYFMVNVSACNSLLRLRNRHGETMIYFTKTQAVLLFQLSNIRRCFVCFKHICKKISACTN